MFAVSIPSFFPHVFFRNASNEDISDHYETFAIIGLFVGFFFSWIMMQVLIAAINTIFVLWAEDVSFKFDATRDFFTTHVGSGVRTFAF